MIHIETLIGLFSSMKYVVNFYNGEKVLAEVRKTEKTIRVELLEDFPPYAYGCEDVLKTPYTIRLNARKGYITRDHVIDWGDDRFTVYFSRAGIPTYFEPR